MNDNVYIWSNYTQFPKETQEQLLKQFMATVPEMSLSELLASLAGAPTEVKLRVFNLQEYDVQVVLFKKVIPLGARPVARRLMKPDPRWEQELRHIKSRLS